MPTDENRRPRRYEPSPLPERATEAQLREALKDVTLRLNEAQHALDAVTDSDEDDDADPPRNGSDGAGPNWGQGYIGRWKDPAHDQEEEEEDEIRNFGAHRGRAGSLVIEDEEDEGQSPASRREPARYTPQLSQSDTAVGSFGARHGLRAGTLLGHEEEDDVHQFTPCPELDQNAPILESARQSIEQATQHAQSFVAKAAASQTQRRPYPKRAGRA